MTLDALVAAVEGSLDGDSRGRFEEIATEIESVREAWLDEWRPKLESDEVPINPYRVVHELDRVVEKEEVIVTHDVGNARDFMARCRRPIRHHTTDTVVWVALSG